MVVGTELEREVRAFVEKHNITCPETIYQQDSVILDAMEFIERLVDFAGYKEQDEDDF